VTADGSEDWTVGAGDDDGGDGTEASAEGSGEEGGEQGEGEVWTAHGGDDDPGETEVPETELHPTAEKIEAVLHGTDALVEISEATNLLALAEEAGLTTLAAGIVQLTGFAAGIALIIWNMIKAYNQDLANQEAMGFCYGIVSAGLGDDAPEYIHRPDPPGVLQKPAEELAQHFANGVEAAYGRLGGEDGTKIKNWVLLRSSQDGGPTGCLNELWHQSTKYAQWDLTYPYS
jgi:hypothetical protein